MTFPNRIFPSLSTIRLTGLAVLLSVPCFADPGLRPPAVPLVVNEPMLSIWSEADQLTDDVTRHWTHKEHPLTSLIRIDGKAFRLMGKTPADTPAFPQQSVVVTPTRSIYEFEGEGVHVTLTFLTPALPSDLEVLARPVTYLTWLARSTDGKEHAVSVYDSVGGQLAVNTPKEQIEWARESFGAMTGMRIGSHQQGMLGVSGDDARIDWGWAWTAAPAKDAKAAIGADASLAAGFAANGSLPDEDDHRMPRAAGDDAAALAWLIDFGKVGQTPVAKHVLVGYDEVYQIDFFRQKLRPYWRRKGATPQDLFQAAERDYPALEKRCEEFDRALTADAAKAGGERYAQMCALAYRQCLGGNGLVADRNGEPMLFTKENSSNGDIATVDVIFPMDPIWVLLSPTLAKASLAPVLVYAASDHWKFPNAPHDLGTYPVAHGRDDGGEAMPVEESGNMLILMDAIAQADGNAKFSERWWPQLTQWAKFLEKFGLDPENQLCTDDFMGHLAHNANLSIKAIVALAAYGDLCKMRGDHAEAEKYARLAREDADHWMKVADAGGHSLLAFDKPNTWSQKYNLVWDNLLGLNVFPSTVAQDEIAFYKTKMQQYGLPLDSRTKLTKSDWTVWTATMATSRADFEALVSPMWDYLNHTGTHMPFVDSYETNKIDSRGFKARPVIGGIFIRMLADRSIWKKWASADKADPKNWAALPPQPKLEELIPTSEHQMQTWRYTTAKPPADWTKPEFDDSSWKEGPAGFGNNGAHHTDWTTDDIWIRRTVTMPPGDYKKLMFRVFHDEDIEVYVNGVLAASEGGYITSYQNLEIDDAAMPLLKPGAKVTLAAHCHQTVGGQGIDLGISAVTN